MRSREAKPNCNVRSTLRMDILTYRTLMVHLDPSHSNAGLLKIVGDLAERFDARVIGIVACREMQFLYGDGYIPADLLDQDRGQLEKRSRRRKRSSGACFRLVSELLNGDRR